MLDFVAIAQRVSSGLFTEYAWDRLVQWGTYLVKTLMAVQGQIMTLVGIDPVLRLQVGDQRVTGTCGRALLRELVQDHLLLAHRDASEAAARRSLPHLALASALANRLFPFAAALATMGEKMIGGRLRKRGILAQITKDGEMGPQRKHVRYRT